MGILMPLTTDSVCLDVFLQEALSIKCRHVFMSDIGRARTTLNVQLTLKCAYDIMPSTKRQNTKAPKLLWELQFEKKRLRKSNNILMFVLG